MYLTLILPVVHVDENEVVALFYLRMYSWNLKLLFSCTTTTGVEERALLLQLLHRINSAYLQIFAFFGSVMSISDGRYVASFLVPTSRLAIEDFARLGKTTWCVVCRSEPTVYECNRCQSIQYCGKA
jgi:hypothetical protein